jgi:hypothetical protein
MEGRVVLALVSFLHSKDLRVFLIYECTANPKYASSDHFNPHSPKPRQQFIFTL